MRRRRLASLAAVAAAVVAADQVTKSLAVATLSRGPLHVIGPIDLVLTYNRGIAFSLGSGLTVPIVIVVLVAIGMLVAFARRVPSVPVILGAGLVLGGALGNLADRLVRGHDGAVVDFVHVGFWPTFNLADASIVVGCALLAIESWRRGARASTGDGAAR